MKWDGFFNSPPLLPSLTVYDANQVGQARNQLPLASVGRGVSGAAPKYGIR